MILRPVISAYLVRPRLSSRINRRWPGFRTQLVSISRHDPRLFPRIGVVLLIWTAGVGSWSYLSSPHSLPGQRQFQSLQADFITSPAIKPTSQALTTAVAASALPDGPTGQLLPPGSMAPDGTYRNSYARGQCTWYVAGRRQVPGHWGNAVSWYYHAASSDWAVGPTPAVAAIAWTASGRFGHVALVERVSADGNQIYISEMNYLGPGIKSYRWMPSQAFKYIY
jgi:surface antigen